MTLSIASGYAMTGPIVTITMTEDEWHRWAEETRLLAHWGNGRCGFDVETRHPKAQTWRWSDAASTAEANDRGSR